MGTVVVLIGAAVGASASEAAALSPDGLTLISVKQSLLGTHSLYQQTYRGLPVVDGFYETHTDSRTGAVTVNDGRLAVAGSPSTSPGISASEASTVADDRSGGSPLRTSLVIMPGAPATLAWEVIYEREDGSTRTLVDARNGSVQKTVELAKRDTGTGRVFLVNAVVATQNADLVDNHDRDSAVPSNAYMTVTLTDLDSSGQLVGAYAQNVTKRPVTSATQTYIFSRSQSGFEQVMAYYYITYAQRYIQSLGFNNINNRSQPYRTAGLSADDSFYDPATQRITYGTGGVDDAEDAEVIWHEYGHAMLDNIVLGFGQSGQSAAIGEGFADYWAYSLSDQLSNGFGTACIADWDATSYSTGNPPCKRRVDTAKHYPESMVGEAHRDGEIWSGALFAIHNSLGRARADKVILQSMFLVTPNALMNDVANAIVTAAINLSYTTAEVDACRTALMNRGFAVTV